MQWFTTRSSGPYNVSLLSQIIGDSSECNSEMSVLYATYVATLYPSASSHMQSFQRWLELSTVGLTSKPLLVNALKLDFIYIFFFCNWLFQWRFEYINETRPFSYDSIFSWSEFLLWGHSLTIYRVFTFFRFSLLYVTSVFYGDLELVKSAKNASTSLDVFKCTTSLSWMSRRC